MKRKVTEDQLQDSKKLKVIDAVGELKKVERLISRLMLHKINRKPQLYLSTDDLLAIQNIDPSLVRDLIPRNTQLICNSNSKNQILLSINPSDFSRFVNIHPFDGVMYQGKNIIVLGLSQNGNLWFYRQGDMGISFWDNILCSDDLISQGFIAKTAPYAFNMDNLNIQSINSKEKNFFEKLRDLITNKKKDKVIKVLNALTKRYEQEIFDITLLPKNTSNDKFYTIGRLLSMAIESDLDVFKELIQNIYSCKNFLCTTFPECVPSNFWNEFQIKLLLIASQNLNAVQFLLESDFSNNVNINSSDLPIKELVELINNMAQNNESLHLLFTSGLISAEKITEVSQELIRTKAMKVEAIKVIDFVNNFYRCINAETLVKKFQFLGYLINANGQLFNKLWASFLSSVENYSPGTDIRFIKDILVYLYLCAKDDKNEMQKSLQDNFRDYVSRLLGIDFDRSTANKTLFKSNADKMSFFQKFSDLIPALTEMANNNNDQALLYENNNNLLPLICNIDAPSVKSKDRYQQIFNDIVFFKDEARSFEKLANIPVHELGQQEIALLRFLSLSKDEYIKSKAKELLTLLAPIEEEKATSPHFRLFFEKVNRYINSSSNNHLFVNELQKDITTLREQMLNTITNSIDAIPAINDVKEQFNAIQRNEELNRDLASLEEASRLVLSVKQLPIEQLITVLIDLKSLCYKNRSIKTAELLERHLNKYHSNLEPIFFANTN